MTREEFTAEIRRLSEAINCDSTIAENNDVDLETLRRWVKGQACPLPRMRSVVIKETKKILEAK